MIPDETIEQVREAADVVGIIGESVDLRRTGTDWRGPCPFHGGKHRNFAVIPRKGMFYCYVCHEAGDVFTWLMKRFGMDYPTAVRDVARRVGIPVPEQSAAAGPDPNEPLYGAVAAAHDWFGRQLAETAEGEAARRYLESREIPLDTALQHGLGYAPGGPALLRELDRLGIPVDRAIEAGLALRRDDGAVRPRFSGRLLFPIHDLRGRVVAFGGRLLQEGEPKYLNTPETPIFHKGRQLYNLHQARAAIRQAETAVLVEGYFDVLRLMLAGIAHVVAPLGTALTPDQAALVHRYTNVVTLLYDSDAAGLRATFRAGDELLRQSVRVRVATMPPGEDPDTIVRRGGAAALAPVLRDAVDLMERKLQLLDARGWFAEVERRREALDRLLPTIRAAADPITRDLYLSRVAERSGVTREVLADELRAAPRSAALSRPEPRAARPAAARTPALGRRAEEQLLRVMTRGEVWRARAREQIVPDLLEVPEFRELFRALTAAPDREPATEQLSPGAAVAWERVRGAAESLAEANLDDMFAVSAEVLLSRPDLRAAERIADPVARRARVGELRVRFPQAVEAWELQRRVRRR